MGGGMSRSKCIGVDVRSQVIEQRYMKVGHESIDVYLLKACMKIVYKPLFRANISENKFYNFNIKWLDHLFDMGRLTRQNIYIILSTIGVYVL